MFTVKSLEGFTELVPGVRLKTLAYGERTHFTEVHFDKGAVIPLHHHVHEQTGRMISGCLRFTIDGKEIIAREGDSWNIASNVPHAAEALEESVVVEVFSPVREDYLAMGKDPSG